MIAKKAGGTFRRHKKDDIYDGKENSYNKKRDAQLSEGTDNVPNPQYERATLSGECLEGNKENVKPQALPGIG